MDTSPVINFRKLVYVAIPKSDLTIPSGVNGDVRLLLPPEELELRLLGYEKDPKSTFVSPSTMRRNRKNYKGTLLFSYEGYEGKQERTFLASYHLSTKKFQCYYRGPVTTFVSASLRIPNISRYRIDLFE